MISVIIPIYNQHELTQECIEAVRLNTQDYEFILIDNGSIPPIEKPYAGFVDVTLIRNEVNLGFPAAVNQGIKAAKGEVICLLNNDVIVTPGSINRLAELLDEYAIVGPTTGYCAGVQKVSAPIYENLNELYGVAKQAADTFAGIIDDVSFVIGFLMLFPKALFDEIGEFDESMWPCSGEEIDFCFRARAKGHKVGIVKEVFVHHEGSITFREMQDDGILDCRKLFTETDKHLAEKWGADFWRKQIVKENAPYLIMAPEYQNSSAGVRALYRLKDEIIKRGYEANIVQKGFASNDDIVVYPEIVSGNPLGGKTVARWVLNYPGKLGGTKEYDSRELIFTWDKVYCDGHVLTVPIIEDFFRNEGLKRSGQCFWIGKGKRPDIENYNTDNWTEITYDWPATREELAKLLNEKEVFYTYDNNTALVSEAKACGCKVFIIGEELEGGNFDENIKHYDEQIDAFIQETQEAAKNDDNEIRLAIGVPCSFPSVPASFFHSYALMNKPAHTYIHANNGHIDDLRNNIVERALYEGVTHLIMMDVDQVYPPETIKKLLAHNLPVVGCRVHRRYPPFDSMGGITPTWTDYTTVWAKAWTVSSNEQTDAKQMTLTRIQKFKIRYRSILKSSWRIK